MKKILIALATAGVGLSTALVATPATAAAPQAPDHSPPAPEWTQCATLPAGIECAFVTVPQDYDRPWGKKIKIAVSRKKATDLANYQGAILFNPGGPGGSGLGYPVSMQTRLGAALAAQYDLVGFDPRGVGASEPALRCDPTYSNPVRPDYVPGNLREELAWVKKAQGYSRACDQKYGDLLRNMTTVDVAKDLDQIRKALGQEQISYVGYSYGTYLGATYATLFPSKVRRLVLDSIVNPERVWYEANIDQNHAFEARQKDFYAWVAKYEPTYHLGTTPAEVEKAFYGARAKLKATPAGGRVGPSELDDTYLAGGYLKSRWPFLANALSKYVNDGDNAAMATAYATYGDSSDDDNTLAVYSAVECSDVRWPRDWGTWHRDWWESYRSAPFLSWGNAWFNAQCQSWPVRGQQPPRVNGKAISSALLFQDTKDAPTPYPGGVEMHKRFPTSRLVVMDGGGNHGLTGRGNACIDNIWKAYLTDGSLPASVPGPDVHCPPFPDPVPPPATLRVAPTPQDDWAPGER
ncbi:peptidase [Sphaerisporangium siamense]|uniref:Pimeloyl-ACP methyl ester carboxylesterase n=1 Tax=Sphaerisporangium siamense TaxID=795645 RepID=A0A7W7D2E7_9ACTN|nr:alpha/beta hydrolase [Sphaerisporangium siamense]MBB4699017.1 pimeloyl-ACP methyl ester carboxylesterase [Sphaerisporangium siamense]GII88454.1 peptidase [Sphaerisporangium siamense]